MDSKGTQPTEDAWSLEPSIAAQNTVNPIRNIVDKLVVSKDAVKPLIPLSIGDPTVFGNLPPPESVIQAVVEKTASGKFNGYGPSTGLPEARSAIASKYTRPEAPLTPNDVIICSGASGALEIAIRGVANPGDNILIPQPGFSLYRTIAGNCGVEARYYQLLPEHSWECDLKDIASKIDSRTRAIIINNPSNPTGSNYSKEHLLEFLKVAQEKRVLVIADEIYADMVFEGQTFHPLASLTSEVPILTVGGIAKQYLVPGWRVGWILIHDRHKRLARITEGLIRLTQVVLGANTLVQAALSDILHKTPASHYTQLNATLKSHADTLVRRLVTIPGLKTVEPQGAMYLMVKVEEGAFPELPDGTIFAQRLLAEENVFVLPGECFMAKQFFRLVTCASVPMLEQACDRIAEFCERYRK